MRSRWFSIRFVFGAMSTCVIASASSLSVHADDVIASGLLRPSKVVDTRLGNLLVAEVGTAASAANSGRVSIIDRDGKRRTLVDGLPSAPTNAANTPSGPSGLFLSGRTLYVSIGEGNPTLAGPVPRTEVVNPNPSSPIFSSVLAIHFSAAVEKKTTGVTLSLADHIALASGKRLVRKDSTKGKITIELITDFPDYVAEPLPILATNVRHSHPYGVVADDDFLYVVDGGYNLVHKVEICSGVFEPLTTFPNVANPLFPTFGPPQSEIVPTSIRWYDGQLLITLFTGFPFASGTSQVVQVDPDWGGSSVLISGLTSAIDVAPVVNCRELLGFLTLEYSTAQLAGAPGRLQFFDADGQSISVLSETLITPSSLVYEAEAGSIIVAELTLNRLIEVQ